jgi:enolase
LEVYRPGEDVVIALDPASSGFFENGMYQLPTEGRAIDGEGMVALYAEWVRKYPIAVLEDGLAEDDWDGWKVLNRELGDKIELVGDDLQTLERASNRASTAGSAGIVAGTDPPLLCSL